MRKFALAAVGGFSLLASAALAGPPPNDVGTAFMGGGVFYNPAKQSEPARSVHRAGDKVVGETQEGGGVYRVAPNNTLVAGGGNSRTPG